LWHRAVPAVVIWETQACQRVPLCGDCLTEWRKRSATTPETAKIFGYRKLTHLNQDNEVSGQIGRPVPLTSARKRRPRK
jgi:hypothetical protein